MLWLNMIVPVYFDFRRKVLGDWKMKNGLNATYGCLLDAFLNAGHNICAEVLCRALKKRSREPSRCTSLCPIETQGNNFVQQHHMQKPTQNGNEPTHDTLQKNIRKNISQNNPRCNSSDPYFQPRIWVGNSNYFELGHIISFSSPPASIFQLFI